MLAAYQTGDGASRAKSSAKIAPFSARIATAVSPRTWPPTARTRANGKIPTMTKVLQPPGAFLVLDRTGRSLCVTGHGAESGGSYTLRKATAKKENKEAHGVTRKPFPNCKTAPRSTARAPWQYQTIGRGRLRDPRSLRTNRGVFFDRGSGRMKASRRPRIDHTGGGTIEPIMVSSFRGGSQLRMACGATYRCGTIQWD